MVTMTMSDEWVYTHGRQMEVCNSFQIGILLPLKKKKRTIQPFLSKIGNLEPDCIEHLYISVVKQVYLFQTSIYTCHSAILPHC